MIGSRRIKARFSKQALSDRICLRLRAIESEFKFTRQNGWAQVEGSGEVANRAYGEWNALHGLWEEMGLPEPTEVPQ